MRRTKSGNGVVSCVGCDFLCGGTVTMVGASRNMAINGRYRASLRPISCACPSRCGGAHRWARRIFCTGTPRNPKHPHGTVKLTAEALPLVRSLAGIRNSLQTPSCQGGKNLHSRACHRSAMSAVGTPSKPASIPSTCRPGDWLPHDDPPWAGATPSCAPILNNHRQALAHETRNARLPQSGW
jgi:hypothetical protein